MCERRRRVALHCLEPSWAHLEGVVSDASTGHVEEPMDGSLLRRLSLLGNFDDFIPGLQRYRCTPAVSLSGEEIALGRPTGCV